MIPVLRKSLLWLGWGGIAALLALTAINRIASLSADLGALEAKYATLHNQLALLAYERQISQETLLRHEAQLLQVRTDLQNNLGAYSTALRDSEAVRAWSALALPAELGSLFHNAAGQPANPAPGSGQSEPERGNSATGGRN